MPNYPQSWHRATKSSKPARKTPEGIVLAAIRDYLVACRLGPVVRQQVGMASMGEHGERKIPYGEVGASDLRVDLEGDPRSIFVEVKSASGQASKAQLDYLARQAARSNFTLVAKSADEVYEYLTAVGFCVPRPGGRRAA